jgi:hypothetical protein
MRSLPKRRFDLKKRHFSTTFAAALFLCTSSPSLAQMDTPILVGIGDSIGEGVQSADASHLTQPSSYLNWVARKMGVPFALPLIQSGPFGIVGDTSSRSRVSPSVLAVNLSVSGAEVSSILDDRADAASEDEIDSETDLVLFPRLGGQIEIAEALNPPLIIGWIGNNDILGTATSFDQRRFYHRFHRRCRRLGPDGLGYSKKTGSVKDAKPGRAPRADRPRPTHSRLQENVACETAMM